MPQFIIRTSDPTRLTQLFAELGATLEPLAIGDIGGKGGGAPLAKGFAAPVNVDAGPAKTGVLNQAARADHKHHALVGDPVTVTGTTNAEGNSVALARANHQHRLEVNVRKDGSLVGGQPILDFIGSAVTAVEVPADNSVEITIADDKSGLAVSGDATTVLIDDVAMSSYLDVPFTVPAGGTGVWEVEIEASGTILLDYPGDPDPVGMLVNYDLFISGGGLPLAFSAGRVSVTSTSDVEEHVTIHTMGTVALSPGAHTAQLRAQSSLIGGSTASFTARRMIVRLFRPSA